jgi:hypothetical protein
MSELFVAETQYDDYEGTAAFDTHEGGGLHQLFNKYCSGKGYYFPVGLELGLGALTPDSGGNITLTVVAVKHADYGKTMDEIMRNTSGARSATLYRFDAVIPLGHFGAFFKRMDVKVISKSLKHLSQMSVDIIRP